MYVSASFPQPLRSRSRPQVNVGISLYDLVFKAMSKLSGKHQVTIPVRVLREAGLAAGDEVVVRASGTGRIEVERAEDLLRRYAGSQPPAPIRRVTSTSSVASGASRPRRRHHHRLPKWCRRSARARDRGAARPLDAGATEIAIGASVYAEVMVRPLARHTDAEVDGFLQAIQARLIPIDREVARRAADLRARHRSLRLPDALALAAALSCDAKLSTLDHGLRRIARAEEADA